jgi:hypothetical protein
MTETATPNFAPERFPLNPITLGTIYSILSAVFYTLMGICQRALSESCDLAGLSEEAMERTIRTPKFSIMMVSGLPSQRFVGCPRMVHTPKDYSPC